MRSLEEVLAHIEWTYDAAVRHPYMIASDACCLEDCLMTLDSIRWFILDVEQRESRESYTAFLKLRGFCDRPFVQRTSRTHAEPDKEMNDFLEFWKGFLQWRAQFK